jgi:hypothetical protein
MKELKDYLHLYLGCDVKCGIKTIAKLTADETTQDLISLKTTLSNPEYKPILRPLSDMTEDEEYEYWKTKGGNAFNEFQGETTLFLLSKHFDIFGLIEAALAIDKSTLK